MHNLVIVESPTKAKTITKFLDKNYRIESSFGHVRDLPKTKMGIDIEHHFLPKYIVPKDKTKQVEHLKELAAKAETIYFATDEDREGEAIAWHLSELLDGKNKETKRITFHEITESAIKEAIANPREIDKNLVDAQQARRIVDRLVGYELSPFLWKKVARGLSAGRVQSVAVRLIVEREREIQSFKSEEYWSIDAIFATEKKEQFEAHLEKVNNKKNDPTSFQHSLELRGASKKLDKLAIKNSEEAEKIKAEIETDKFHVDKITKKQIKRQPLPPYTTSTLQQDANHRLGFSAQQTMLLAQQLYEGIEIKGEGSVGLITYMRTDSFNLANKFLSEAREYISDKIGQDFLPEDARRFKTKSKGAQEAHEAIRPTSAYRHPDEMKEFLNDRQFKLYRLIWQRAIASQMKEALFDNTSIDIVTNNLKYTFRSTGQIMIFPGFLKIYSSATKEVLLPELVENQPVDLEKLSPTQHFTEPSARYSEATLVKTLEEKGIGRPSTYAPTIATIITRKYIEKTEDKKLKPTDIAFVVTDLLVTHFTTIVDYDFTAQMENQLDEIAEGKIAWQPVVAEFYTPFKETLDLKTEELSKQELTQEKTDVVCDKCGAPMIIKLSRFGKFLACSNYPECKSTKHLNQDGTIESNEPQLLEEKCPECDSPLQKRRGRFGPFVGCSNYPKCKYIQKNAVTGTGVKCPKCGQGEIVPKRSRRGKTFYACNRYPDCKNAYWSKPTGEECPECKSLLVAGAKDTFVCSNKECNFKK